MLELIRKYKKAAGVVLVAVLTAAVAALTDNVISPREWTVITGIGVSAVGTAVVPNLPAGIGGYAKSVVTFLVAGMAVLTVVIDGGLTMAEVYEVVLAGLAALGITVIPRNIGDYRQLAQRFGTQVGVRTADPGDGPRLAGG
jgi:uncharacterized membrane protein YhhN